MPHIVSKMDGANEDYSCEKHPIPERIVHWLGGTILDVHHKSLESCLIFAAGIEVTEREVCKQEEKHRLMMTLYQKQIEALPADKIQRPKLKDDLNDKLLSENNAISGQQLYRRFQEMRKIIRSQYQGELKVKMREKD